MRHNDLDRILSREENLLPSSGFAASVMASVRSEASTPPPIPFPWKRVTPGLAVAGLALLSIVVGLTELTRGALASQLPPSRPLVLPLVLPSILQTTMNAGTGWVFMACLLYTSPSPRD